MTPENFTYWLQGFVELNGDCPNEFQWQEIKNHLALVFNKVTPVNRKYCSFQNITPDIHYVDLANTGNAPKEVTLANSSFYTPTAPLEKLDQHLTEKDLVRINKTFSC